jgi:hypothetical protein
MTFIVPPVDGAAVGHGARPLRFRRRRLPSELVEQLHRAAELCEDLAEAGVQLRFDAAGDGARVRAVLVDSDGDEIREVALTDVVALELGV